MKLSNPYRCADHRLSVTRPVSPASFKVLYHKPWNPCYLVSIHAVEVGCRDPQRLEDVTIDFRLVGNIPPVTDRKSTRLNSSHTVISYAVFCLKKKINIYHIICNTLR